MYIKYMNGEQNIIKFEQSTNRESEPNNPMATWLNYAADFLPSRLRLIYSFHVISKQGKMQAAEVVTQFAESVRRAQIEKRTIRNSEK